MAATNTRRFTPFGLTTLFMTVLLAGCAQDGAMHASAPVQAPAQSAAADPDDAGVFVDNDQKGDTIHVNLTSWRDLPFKTVKRQAYDYSCGSAAVATLMTYTYNLPTSEKDVFQEMFDKGDQQKIQSEGFSMLDMSRYMNAHGLDAKGYKTTPEAIAKNRLPVIALVNNKGYDHFVVVKTMDDGQVLVGDPSTGNTRYSHDKFAQIWGGLALIVTNKATVAHNSFADAKEWRYAHAHAPMGDDTTTWSNDTWNDVAALPPSPWQIAPIATNILPVTTLGVSTVAATSVGAGP